MLETFTTCGKENDSALRITVQNEIFNLNFPANLKSSWKIATLGLQRRVNPLPYDVFGGAQPMACGLFGPTEVTTLSVMKTILMT